jgi:hypothetical protein
LVHFFFTTVVFDVQKLGLVGTFPNLTSPKMSFLDVSGNSLHGNLDANPWASMVSLKQISLSDNLLTGTIPSSLGKVPLLQFADFKNNDFTGSMPVEICSLTPDPLKYLQADCNGTNPQIVCSCCSFCQ